MPNNSILEKRLKELWKEPDFSEFFQKYAKRPPLKIKKGAMVFYQGDVPDKIYFVKEGYIKMHRVSENGRDSIVYLYGPGSILGVRALTSQDEALKHDAEALTNAQIVTLSRDEYFKILVEHPEYIADLLHVFISRLNYTERKLEGFIMADTAARVANFLSNCAKRFGVKNGKNSVLPFPLTHQIIADFVGAFRETVTIALNKLEAEKIISIEKGVVTIYDRKKLEKKTKIHDIL